ncbi:WSC domain-containing protein [Diplogelasinospora grovesii]|uniref:WSC domain-containing protein n=1 Tax=Diplogelasinospora grovesii TaxID=303347 RepID=A0AAN6NC47_9PEZI|nr:WSC domain-containing protein [Diplogelasinospora grovesii]
MASFSMTAALAAVAILGRVQAWTVPLPPCTSPFQPFVYSGCFADTGSPDALSFRSPLDQQNMTIETCVAECKGNGYRYAGLEYYGICFCGETVNGAQLDDSQCTYPCTGNSSEICGGSNIISVYQDPTFLPVDKTTTLDYVPLGCWTDDSSIGRALGYPQDQLNSSTMTTETCLQACKDGGFPFAGTEYSGECYCGQVVGNFTSSAPATDCAMPCNGDSTETCGGPSRLSLYVAKDLESLEPCGYVPPVSSSSVPPVSSSSTAPPASSSSSVPPVSSTTTPASSSTTPASSTTTPASSSSSPSVPPASSTTTGPASSTTPTSTASSTATSSCTTSTTSSTAPPTSSKPVTTTSTSSVCTTTTVIPPTPPTCEYKCGNWCSSPLPDWEDVTTCKTSYSNCKLQVAACFGGAGWPGSMDCFAFAAWCSKSSDYCNSGGSWTGKSRVCSKQDFCGRNPPKNPSPSPSPSPSTVTITVACKPTTAIITTTTTTTTTPPPPSTTPSKCPIPTPSNICTQPTNKQYGYAPGSPVGGIELPIVTCNDVKNDWPSSPFKLYTDSDSTKCGKYPRSGCSNACQDACKAQYEQCQGTYAKGCQQGNGGGGWSSGNNDDDGWQNKGKSHWRRRRSSTEIIAKRTFGGGGGGWTDSYSTATNKCQAQYSDCVAANKNTNGGGKCGSYGSGW